MFLKSKSKKNSFFKKIVLSFLTMTIIVTILLTTFLTINYLKTTVKMAYDFNANLLAQSNYSITYINELAKSLSDSLYNNKDIVTFLNASQRDNATTVRAFQTLTNQLFPLNYVESVYMYNAEINMLISSKYGEQKSIGDFFDQDIAKMLASEGADFSPLRKPFPHTAVTPKGAKNICSYAQFETNKQGTAITSALIINIDAKTLTNSMQAINSFHSDIPTQFAVVDKGGFVLDTNFIGSQEVRAKLAEEIRVILAQPTGSGNKIVSVGNTDYLLSYSSQNLNNWYIFGAIPRNSLLQDVIYTSIISLIVVIILFLISGGICFYFARLLNNPIKQITDIVQGKSIDETALSSIKTDEFQFLTSVFRTMKEQNDHFNAFSGETEYTIKQDLLVNLVLGKLLQSIEKTKSRLEAFHLSFLAESKLCMCILKIDSYSEFSSLNNQRERWAMLYAIVNITAELSAKYFTSEAVSTLSDKFVILIKYDDKAEVKEFKSNLNRMLEEIAICISNGLGVSLSMAYSTTFKGLEHIPSTYKNLEEQIQMKMRYGHGCIISPDMLDEVESEYFQIPVYKEDLLIQKINAFEQDEAAKLCKQILDQLFEYSYGEVISYIMHLAYTIHASVQLKNPSVKQEITLLLKNFMADLPGCEVADDIDLLLGSFVAHLCDKIRNGKDSSEMQNNDLIANRMCEIVEKEYGNSNLCLSFLAEELGMSPNYIGHIFKLVQTVSVPKYISELRMKKVANYLANTKLSLDEIAKSVGMEKNNYFYTCFKKSFGVSLSEYKRTMLNRDTTGQLPQ